MQAKTSKAFRFLAVGTIVYLSGCASIVNDANIPLAVSFSDGSYGVCTFRNKRGAWQSAIPTTSVMIRRSDDALVYECSTEDGRTVTGSIKSEIEAAKLGASVLFLDLGITDAITDKHRTYQGNLVIPIPQKKSAVSQSNSASLAAANNETQTNFAADRQLRAVTESEKNGCELVKPITTGAGGTGDPSVQTEKAMENALSQAASAGADSYYIVDVDTTSSGASVVLEALKCN